MAVTVLVLATGGVLLFTGDLGNRSTTPSTDAVTTSPVAGSAKLPTASASLQIPVNPVAPTTAPGVPVLVSVPSLGISSSLQSLGILADHTLQPPTLYQRAGWYADGVRPGAVGPAIIAGHVDSYQGPAVFFRLRDIKVGADIAVRDSLGVVRHFAVTDVQSYPKSAFPTEAVYGPTALPVLRLITCTGDFDASKRSYVDNLVVSARLDAPRAG